MAEKKHLNECRLCGTYYPSCGYCDSTNKNNSWRKVACCWGHYLALQPMIKYDKKSITKDEARAEIEDIIKEYGEFTVSNNMKSIYDEIMSQPQKTTFKKKTKTEFKSK